MNRSSLLWNIVLWSWTASEVAILLGTRTRRSSGKVRDQGSLLILWATIFGAISAASWIGKTQPQPIFGGASWIKLASVCILIAGLTLRWTAIVQLGKAFSVNVAIREDQTVHKTGLFRLVRHPSYTGLLVIFAAIGLNTRNWGGMATILIPTTAALLYRIHVEEAALGHAFGDEYAQYSRTKKRMIPGIY